MRKRTKDRLERLEENSEYHRSFMNEVNHDLDKLLDHLGLKIETVPSRKIIIDLSIKEGKKEET